MKTPRAQSIGRRLSLWLAIQSFVGLLIVSAAVYGATVYAFDSRQLEDLTQTQSLVLRLATEAGHSGDETMLRHKLGDFLAGDSKFGLTLRQIDGSVFFELRHPLSNDTQRITQFEIPPAISGRPSLQAQLALDIRNDITILRRIGAALFVSAIGGAVLISLGGFILIWAGLRPLRNLSEQVQELAADTLHRRVDSVNQPEELIPLITQFNNLLGRLERSYEQLEGFNADVAHELLTPLTTLTSSSELALRAPQGIDDLRDVLVSNLEDLRRVSGIVHDMLFLSQADRGAVARRVPTPSLAFIARQVANYHEAALADADLIVDVAGDAAGAFDTALLQRALSNLVSNATRFADSSSIVRVKIRESSLDEVEISVENRGGTIDPQILPRLFDRFFRGDPSRSDATKNHGLGLSIVAAIARMHGGQPTASSSDGSTIIGMTLKRS